jgi:hypothetical protein
MTATNTLTGKRFATTTDITGAWSMTIPQNGRYVLRTEFAAFAASTHEALLNALARSGGEFRSDFGIARGAAGCARSAAGADAADYAGDAAVGREWGAEPEPDEFAGAGTDAAEGGTTASGAALPGAAAKRSTFSRIQWRSMGSRGR